MFIRPRVHVISRGSVSSDLFWYVTCANLSGVPTFSVNNTGSNLPVKLRGEDGKSDRVLWMKGHYK